MPAVLVPTDQLALGPGYFYYAPLATALPTDTVAAGAFTDTWPAGWVELGATDDGTVFNYALATDNVEVEEYNDPVKVVVTGRTVSIAAALVQIGATALKRALNGGTITTTGTAGTTLNSFVPPIIGAEVRAMVGWESQASDERLVIKQALQISPLAIARHKGADKSLITVEYRMEQPSDGSFPFRYSTAGIVRV